MASDPADLIREADAALDGITPGPWEASGFDNMPHDVVQMEDDEHGTPWAVDQVAGQVKPRDAEFIAAAPDLVRRLRDELRAEQKDFEVIANALDEERAYSAHLKGEVSRAKEWLGVNAATRFAEFREAQRWAEWFAAERDYIRAIRRDDLDYCERTTAALAEANATIEARDDALMRAGRDNLRLHRIVEQVRALHVPNDGACDDGCCTVCDECDRSWPCDTKRAVDGAPDPRRIETAAELDALPVGAIVRDDDGDYWIKHTDDPKSLGDWRHWQGAVTTAPTVFSLSASAFLTLLWLPEVSS